MSDKPEWIDMSGIQELRLRPSQFTYGDELGGGRHVAGTEFVKGGVRVDYIEGGHGIYDGRRKFSANRGGDIPQPPAAEPERDQTERVVVWYDVDKAEPRLVVGITDRAAVLLGERPDGPESTSWTHRISDPAAIAQLQEILESAQADQARVARRLYPSALREHVRTSLADGPQSFGSLIIGSGATTGDLRMELRSMTSDGELTIVPPSGQGGLAKYRLI